METQVGATKQGNIGAAVGSYRAGNSDLKLNTFWDFSRSKRIDSAIRDHLKREEILIPESERKRLSVTIESLLNLSDRVPWDHPTGLVGIARTPEDVIEVMKLRSDVYNEVGYTAQMPDDIKGINYHPFDQNSVLIYRKNENGEVVGTISMVLDSVLGLPSDGLFTRQFLSESRESDHLSELSRFAIRPDYRGIGNSTVFKEIYAGVHELALSLGVSHFIMTSFASLSKKYTTFGETTLLNILDSYGNLEGITHVLAWNPNVISEGFKKNYVPLLEENGYISQTN